LLSVTALPLTKELGEPQGRRRGGRPVPHWLVAVGSIVGLITGIYTFFEKVLRQRRLAWITRSAERRHDMLVRIRNRADQDIAIIDNSVNPPIYLLAYSPHLMRSGTLKPVSRLTE
jgi:hypothetical protein